MIKFVKKNIIILNKKILVTIYFVFISAFVFTQGLGDIKNLDISSLSDEQIATYWGRIQKEGYSMSQLETLAKAQDVSASKVAEFKRRVYGLNRADKQAKNFTDSTPITSDVSEAYGVQADKVIGKKKNTNAPFGYDFFNNSKISFTPSVNIAIPDNYQIGPGDELMIDLWGASEITYTARVDRRGNIKINGVGFIYVNGFSLEAARKKISTKLKKKHAGIGAPKDSYSHISTNITVSKIRTVQVNIIGEVKAPGTYALNSLSTVLNALYVAGGPNKMGTFREVKLVRKNETIATLDIYDYLLDGAQKGNFKLQDQDVLLVGPYQNLVTVEGAVKRTGIYELKEGQTLSDLIAYFGGFTSKAYTDLLILERLDGTQKVVKEVKLSEASKFEIKAGDKILVQEVLDRYKNKVTVSGEVYRPGNYELLPNMTLRGLLLKADGITPEAFLTRGIITRNYDNTYQENIPFSVAAILAEKTDIDLQNNDVVQIFNKDNLREPRTILVQGAVNKPNTLAFVSKMQIEDVIALSGGLKEGADPNNITISRRLKDGSFKTLSKLFTLSSETNLALNNGTPFYIEPFDQINVRSLKGYAAQQYVKVTGQVNYSGTYVLENKNERISDLVKRAGGLTEFAYLKGATLFRKTEDNPIKKLIYNVESEDVGVDKLKEFSKSNVTSIGINLEKIMQNPGADSDLILLEGDELVIPEIKETVQVSGEVLVPSLVKYRKEYRLKDYVNSSGGFTDAAKKSKIFVRYSNGQIKTVSRFLFFTFYPKLAPGADVFIPTKVAKEKMSTQEVLGITSSIATLALIIRSLTQ